MLSRPERTLVLLLAALAGCDDGGRARVPIGPQDGSATAPPGLPPGGDPDRPTRCEDSVGKQDFDRDGFTPDSGDCDDCDAARGPGALDVPGDGIDQDCKGGDATGPIATCDLELDEDGDAGEVRIEDAARALGLCTPTSRGGNLPGLVGARWLRLDGTERLADPRQVWLPARFGAGVLPREGARMLVLSTGVARDALHDDYTPACDAFGGLPDLSGVWPGGVPMPAELPRSSSQCEDQRVDASARAYDDVGLELTLRAPTNATALAFDSILFTSAYPDLLCSPAGDGFVALLEDAPRRFASGNVLVDAEGDPVGADSSLLTVCAAARGTAREVVCTDATLLEGTGFAAGESACAPGADGGGDDVGGASTGWLRTTVKVKPGATFTLRIHLWDSRDPLRDTTVALDHLQFLTTPHDDDAPATVRQ